MALHADLILFTAVRSSVVAEVRVSSFLLLAAGTLFLQTPASSRLASFKASLIRLNSIMDAGFYPAALTTTFLIPAQVPGVKQILKIPLHKHCTDWLLEITL